MATIQFGGLASGLKTNELIEGLVKVERRSIDLLQAQGTRYQAQQGVLSILAGSLASIKSAAQGLSFSVDFNRHTISNSDETVVKATADSTALLGSYVVNVATLAKATVLQSTGYTSTTSTVGQGTLTINVGSASKDITIDATNNTLTGVKDAINDAGAGVTASIVNTGTASTPSYKLIVQSKNTGTENAVTISFAVFDGGSDPFAGGGDVVQAAGDASFTVNGLSLTRSSNSVSDAIPGVTLSLLKEGGASSTVTVNKDTGSVVDNIKKLVDSYNGVAKIVAEQFALNGTTGRQGVLAGDSTARAAVSRLRAAFNSPSGLDGDIRSLSDLGISFQRDGSLKLDEAKLSSALSNDPEAVQKLFLKSENGIGQRIPDAVDSLIDSVSGAITARQNGIAKTLASLEKKIAREEERISAYEARLTAQFTSLEKLISQLNQQGDFLSQKLNTFQNS
jgi:flagellar hook-associated protein 2